MHAAYRMTSAVDSLARRRLAFVVLVALTVGVAGCEELGNPEPIHATPPSRWTGPGVVLLTQTYSVPAARSDELSRRVPGGRFEHVDTEARPGDVVVLVHVEVAWAPRPSGQTIALVTLFRLPDGQKIQRSWSARILATSWYAGFALPVAPVEAVTVLAP